MLICMRKRLRPSAFTHSLARTHIGLEMHARLFLSSSVYINIMNGHFIRHLRMQHHHAHMHSYDYYYHHQVTSDDPLAVSARASVLLYTPFIHSAASERLLLLPPASQPACVCLVGASSSSTAAGKINSHVLMISANKNANRMHTTRQAGLCSRSLANDCNRFGLCARSQCKSHFAQIDE